MLRMITNYFRYAKIRRMLWAEFEIAVTERKWELAENLLARYCRVKKIYKK